LSPSETIASQALLRNIRTRRGRQRAKIGDQIEVCPEALATMQDIQARLLMGGKRGGAALIMDYGEDRPLGDTLRAIKNHRFVHPFESPGDVDLSIMVDFQSLANIALESPPPPSSRQQQTSRYIPKILGGETQQLECFGVLEQSQFLQNMGIDARIADLLRQTKDEKVASSLITSYKRLVDSNQMGSVYKMMAISNQGVRPIGFTIQ